MEQDYYRLLGVAPTASARELKRAWLKLARREHPDVNPGDREARERYGRLQEAWSVLSQRSLREEYDRHGSRPGAEPPAARGRAAGPRVRRWEQVIREVFPDAPAPSHPMGPARGEDVHVVLELAFEEALRGAVRRVAYEREAPCPECQGRGWAAGARVETCPVCDGRGVTEAAQGPWSVRRICPACGGEGERGTPACGRCRGRGSLTVAERRSVRAPAGSASGTRVVVAGGGQAGRRGGQAGDLVVTLRVHPHALLERKGHNLYAAVEVALVAAVLGGPVRVPTLEGERTLRLPAGTQSGRQLVLRGKGVPAPEGGKRGDLYVTVTVVIPSGEDPRVRRAVQELERALAAPGRGGP